MSDIVILYMSHTAQRITAAVVALVVLASVAFGYFLSRDSVDLAAGENSDVTEKPVVPTLPPTVPRTGTISETPAPERHDGEVMFVHRVPGADYGKLGIRHIDGTRTLLEITCERVHIAADQGACMSRDDAIVPSYSTVLFTLEGQTINELSSTPTTLPSRARVSPAGSWASTTSFVSGASYQDIGISAEAIVTMTNAANPDESITLNSFRIDADDSYLGRRFWGATFVNEDEFFVTGLFGAQPEIMAGEVEGRIVRPTGIAGSCPSVSPDGKTLIVKRERTTGDGFELVAIDLETDASYVLGETRSVDDQVEWLNDATIVYALHKEGLEDVVQPELDLWSLSIAPGSTPQLFLPSADSPAALRDN